MMRPYIPVGYIQCEMDCIIELVLDNHKFEAVRIFEVQDISITF
ncbi:Uncharacterised protein [Streptococcus dysgalactiae subsp. equisimilis]|uniref:Uncharacterized protein n=1 Tax=Streptococcus dysgalactiae subsp. equisimilis TaxID=119602 RepID=A0A9X8T0E6_STREQ|nr:Uncharacterised protein [Streptococcus dysgalactiae subsp. equisimilis]VEF05476.1 Uncharacterised protein [Streptococcus dysgalactiae subsp. equisimilis]